MVTRRAQSNYLPPGSQMEFRKPYRDEDGAVYIRHFVKYAEQEIRFDHLLGVEPIEHIIVKSDKPMACPAVIETNSASTLLCFFEKNVDLIVRFR